MTTVHLTNAYHPSSGGIRTFYNELLGAANREGRRVVLIVPGPRTETADVGRFGRIHFVEAPPAPAFDRRYRMLLPHRYLPLVRSTIVDVLEREQPHLVEICDKYSLPYLAAMLRKGWHARVRRPALVGLTCERFDDNMAAYLAGGARARAFTRWYLRHVYGPPFDAHIAISEYTASELRDALYDRAPSFIRVCPMGVDAVGFGPGRASAAMRERLLGRCGGSAASTLLLYAGRLAPEKNLELLVDALRMLVVEGGADYRLVVAGDGPRAAWLRAQATGELFGRILLCGALDRDALAECYASCDVFVHPNPREPFGIGPLEAMASGVPGVMPDAGGVLEYATHANAWLAPPDARAFAAAIRSARRGDHRRIAAALETARSFRWSAVTSRYFALYDDIASRASGMRYVSLLSSTPSTGGLMTNGFRRIADVTGSVVGSPWAFTANVALTALWLLLGPVFQFSDTWQLTMNTAASQVTFLIAFLLQSTQNRDTRALQLKLDELIRSTAGARPQLMQLEELDDDQLDTLKHEFERLRERRSRTTG